MHQRLEGVAVDFLRTEHMVVRLRLPVVPAFLQQGARLTAQEADETSLIALLAPAVEEDVNVVRHEAMHRAGHLVTTAAMQHEPSKARGEPGIEPSRATVPHGEGPVDDGLAPISRVRQAREVSGERIIVGE